jgi:DNA replication protein DnaC
MQGNQKSPNDMNGSAIKQQTTMGETIARFQLREISPERWAQIDAERRADDERRRMQDQDRVLKPLIDSIGQAYANSTLEGLEIYHSAQKPVLADLHQFQANVADHASRGEGLVLFGPSGCGKDHAAASIMLHAAREHLLGGLAVNVRDLAGADFPAAERIIERATSRGIAFVTLSDPGHLNEVASDRLYRIAKCRARAG